MTEQNKPISAQREGGVDIYRKINTACLILIAVVSLVTALIYTRSILIPLVISIFIYTMITPLIRYLCFRMKFPRWLAIVISATIVLVPLVLVVIFISNSISNFVQTFSIYQAKLLESFNKLADLIRSYKIPLPDEMLELKSLQAMLTGPSSVNFLKGVGSNAVKVISYFSMVVIFVFFMLLGSGRTKITNTVIKEIQNKISAYLYIHIIVSIFTGICVGIVYFSVGLELALMFIVCTMVLNFIPNVGSIIAVLLPMPIALMQFGPTASFWIVLIIPACMQFVIGSIMEPKLLGGGMDLHPVTIIGSLVFWTLVWGVPGAFLAVPMTAAVRIILSKLEPTRAFAEILSGRLPK